VEILTSKTSTGRNPRSVNVVNRPGAVRVVCARPIQRRKELAERRQQETAESTEPIYSKSQGEQQNRLQTNAEVTQQLVDHAVNSGIDIQLTDENSAPQGVQVLENSQFNRQREIYNSDLTEEEKNIIQNFIVHLSDEEMKQGRHFLIEGDYLYVFNHAPTKESHFENQKNGGDSFEIIHKYNVQDLTQEQLTYLEKNYDGTSETYSGWISRLGSAERSSNGSADSTENRKTTESTSRLDVGARSGQSTNTERTDGKGRRDSRKLDSIYTPSGTVFGWTQKGKIYLTPQGFNPNTLLHEYTHLWDLMMQQGKKSALVCAGLRAK